MQKRLFFSLLILASFGCAEDSDHKLPKYRFGRVPPSKEQIEEHMRNQVTAVLPNKLGALRMQMHMLEAGGELQDILTADTIEEEFSRRIGATNPYAGALPRAVNNTQLPCFPPIGSQYGNSCASFSSTYYLGSHEVGLAKGYNNKNDYQHVLSPKWSYNMVNRGVNAGSSFEANLRLLERNGVGTLADFPDSDYDYVSWDTNRSHWISAMYNRLVSWQMISGLNQVPQDLTKVKQALANGHLLLYGTLYLTYQFVTIKPHPDTQNLFVGEQACAYVAAPGKGAHGITIVGYNDDIWIDINGNGQVDPGEKGAFLVANSWGPHYMNKGLIWVAYDAFLTHSMVPGAPTNRISALHAPDTLVYAAPARDPRYEPRLLAQFYVGQVKRNQVAVTVGTSDLNHSSPTATLQSGALFNQGGAYTFSGTVDKNPQYFNFPFDITDLINNNAGSQKYYFMLQDNTSGDPTFIHELDLFDVQKNKKIYLSNYPSQVDNGTIRPAIEYGVQQSASAWNPELYVSCTHPLPNAVASGILTVTACAASSAQTVELYIDSELVKCENSMPFLFLVDTKRYKNGEHELRLVASNLDRQIKSEKLTFMINN